MPVAPQGIRGAVITGWASALPPNIVTNDDLSKTLETSDEWIRDRSGIGERHIGGTTAELSIQSATAAMKMARVDPLTIDALVLSTTTPDRCVPATSATVQHALGLKCGAFAKTVAGTKTWFDTQPLNCVEDHQTRNKCRELSVARIFEFVGVGIEK